MNIQKEKSGFRDTEKIVIIGAGAIGRGFLPWCFNLEQYELVFVDNNKFIIEQMKKNGGYTTYMVKKGTLVEKFVQVKFAFYFDEFDISMISSVNSVYMAVGPRNVVKAAAVLKNITCPIILCENDDATVTVLQKALNYDRIYFAIPDVITSCSASDENLEKDPIAIHTEDGELFVDDRASITNGHIQYVSEVELKKQWTAKLFLHNTPHCVAAYLGALLGLKYVHESMEIEATKEIVVGSMNEMLTALKATWKISHDFLDWYSEKELSRFSNKLLMDPISRVAREPFRKLELDGRLIGASQMCFRYGFVPNNILKGIVAAILFENERDNDSNILLLRNHLSMNVFLKYIIGLRHGEVLEEILSSQYDSLSTSLLSLKSNYESKNEL